MSFVNDCDMKVATMICPGPRDRHVCPMGCNNSSWGVSTLPLQASEPSDRVGAILGPLACDSPSRLATWTPHPLPRSLPGSLAKAVSLQQLRSLEDSQSGWCHFWGPLCSSSYDLSQTGHLSSGLWEAATHQSTSPPEGGQALLRDSARLR